MKVRAVLLFFFGISYDVIFRNCSGTKLHIPCFCTNEIHIIFKQLFQQANGTFYYHNYHLFYIFMAHIITEGLYVAIFNIVLLSTSALYK